MGNRYPTPAPDGWGPVVQKLEELTRRIAELEQPTGTSMNSLVAQVQEAIANIGTTINAWLNANSYTKAQIDNKVANPGNISPGNVSASGAVSGSTGSFPNGLNSIDARNRLLTVSYVSGYWDGSGQAGYVPSSIHVKTLLGEYVVPLEEWLAVTPQWFYYNSDEAQTPRAGFIAQWVNEHFPEFVIHDDGEPSGIHYEFMIAGMQSAFRQYVAQTEARLAALEARA